MAMIQVSCSCAACSAALFTHLDRYGIDPQGKLAISSKIANELLAKLLDDLRASKEESLATLTGGCSLTCCG